MVKVKTAKRASLKTKEAFLMCIDFGETNIGVAIGKNGLVVPIKVVRHSNQSSAINELVRTAVENKISGVVVGLPLDAENKETRMSKEIRRFANLLKIALKKPLVYQNEYASTKDTLEEMIEQNIPQKRRRVNDHYTAAIILKRYYESLE